MGQEELADFMKSDWLTATINDIFNSTESDYKTAADKSKRLKASEEEDYMEMPALAEEQHARAHPRVETLPDNEKFESYYWVIEYGYAWIAGFRPYVYWANTTNCFNRMSNMTHHELPEFMNNLNRPRFSVYEKIENTTYLI